MYSSPAHSTCKVETVCLKKEAWLASPAGSVRLWSPWHTPESSGETAADWWSPSTGNVSQTAPDALPPDSPAD